MGLLDLFKKKSNTANNDIAKSDEVMPPSTENVHKTTTEGLYQVKTTYLSATNNESENCSLAQNELCRILTLAIQSNGAYTVPQDSIERVFQDLFHLHGKGACYNVDTYLWNHLPGYTVRDATMRVVENIMNSVVGRPSFGAIS